MMISDASFSKMKEILKKGRESLEQRFGGGGDGESTGQRLLTRSVTIFEGHVSGDIHEKFTLGKKLGQGAFGQVVVATEKATGTDYACKIIGLKNVASSKQLEQIMQEADVMLHVRGHPNILKLHSFFEDPENLYVVEELCTGGDLVEAVTGGAIQFTERLAAGMMSRILQAVAHCHALGVIHRDIKLDNFLLAGGDGPLEDQIRLCDFGCAEFTTEKEIITKSAGTLEYMAPEVFRKHYSYPADVWSCGVVMYSMLCGRFPFDTDADVWRTYNTISRNPVDLRHGLWKNMSIESKECITALLKKEPEKRPTAAQALEMRWLRKEGHGMDKPLERPIRTRLKEFAGYTRFKQEVLRLVAAFMDEKSKTGFRRLFHSYSGGKDLLNLNVAIAALRERGMPQSEITAVQPHIRADKDGCMDFNEFVAVTAAALTGVKMSGMLEQIFAIFDPENTGYITVEGVSNVFKIENREEIRGVLNEAGAVGGRMCKQQFYYCILGPGAQGIQAGEHLRYMGSTNPRGLHTTASKVLREGTCHMM